ncbi:MAG: peptide ABC transporter substrate-binding protein [Candidatus Limnocylindria bacterium]
MREVMRALERRGLAVVAGVLWLAACTGTPQSPSLSVPPVGTGEPIVIGIAVPPFAPSPLFTFGNARATPFRPPAARPELATQLVYNALYRYDDTLSPVPDLAAEPCDIAADQVTITCQLVEASFHDGTPVTADDVAFSYELGRRSPECLWAFGTCYDEMLESVTALDERTVEFRLTAPNATFLTLILPGVFIDSRAVVEAAYAPLAERAPTLDAADYRRASEAINAEVFESQAPNCEGLMADAEALLRAAAIDPLPRDQFHQADGSFDACLYAEWTAVILNDVGASLEAEGLDAIGLAYRALSSARAPIGTGPWRFVEIVDGTRAVFEAYGGYHLGPPATPRIEIRVIRDWAAAPDLVRSGELHWLTLPSDEIYDVLRDDPGIQFAEFPGTTYYMLAYNLRDGMLFAEHAVRSAIELCIDKPATVDAATAGTGDVLYSPIDPFSWAYQPDLRRPERDVDGARGLVEAAGWTEGDDGIYQRDGRRLATDVFVAALDAQRVAFMDLVAEQVRDCGIELTVITADPVTVLAPLEEYPHIAGGYEEPFQALFFGWIHGYDPHDDLWHSRSVTSPEQPRAPNVMGFANPEVDALLDQGIATYDQRERARIYREFQELLAEERPVLFGWANRVHEALDPRLGLTEGEPNLSSPTWFWQLEKLVLTEDR